ncbi:hypothetical protein C122C_0525 [Leuconostoc gelidum subsp. gasicomitatum]|uniref:Uncharacterized protein n=1 Tax=Leuconostoc gasicomitatum TaxID=115778 RepID=A0ABM9V2N7_9LACO|nr:Uncharacterized protein LEKG_0588 [Leuconostoc gasicomitatum KG16-1]CUW09852.1 hypothetical protein C122C_0525 [Leuconostoc gasicomitatum]CUW20241.1 hypothetical protein PB1E_2007 [Leuconostoc gasicomitatum]
MIKKYRDYMIYIGLIISIWVIYFVVIFGFLILFMAAHQAIMFGLTIATILSLFFILIQYVMNSLNSIK